MISKLKVSHAYGINRIDASTIKLLAPILAPPITHVINLSLGTKKIPAKWKLARVLPLLKARDLDTTNPGSFRPVSQLPIISKLVERAVQVQMLRFLEENNQLSRHHHAYRSKTNTTTALIEIMDAIATATDANLITATMSIDMSAAFNSICPQILQHKLRFYGFDDLTLKWIASYIEARSSFVEIGSARSRIVNNPFGVPQRSCLGPLLCLCYVNEMLHIVEDEQ